MRPSSSCGACIPALGKLLGRRHIFRHVTSSEESVEVIAAGERATRQRVCILFELAPYISRRCLMFGSKGVVNTTLLIVAGTSSVHLRWALGQRDVANAVPRHPPGSGSSCEMTCMGCRLYERGLGGFVARCRGFFISCFVVYAGNR